jgi:hypothetical protein
MIGEAGTTNQLLRVQRMGYSQARSWQVGNFRGRSVMQTMALVPFRMGKELLVARAR